MFNGQHSYAGLWGTKAYIGLIKRGVRQKELFKIILSSFSIRRMKISPFFYSWKCMTSLSLYFFIKENYLLECCNTKWWDHRLRWSRPWEQLSQNREEWDGKYPRQIMKSFTGISLPCRHYASSERTLIVFSRFVGKLNNVMQCRHDIVLLLFSLLWWQKWF